MCRAVILTSHHRMHKFLAKYQLLSHVPVVFKGDIILRDWWPSTRDWQPITCSYPSRRVLHKKTGDFGCKLLDNLVKCHWVCHTLQLKSQIAPTSNCCSLVTKCIFTIVFFQPYHFTGVLKMLSNSNPGVYWVVQLLVNCCTLIVHTLLGKLLRGYQNLKDLNRVRTLFYSNCNPNYISNLILL